MYETFFVIGLAFSLLVALLIAIPVVTGAVQFWIYYVRILRNVRKKDEEAAKQQVPPAA
jgi:hypothetical protein